MVAVYMYSLIVDSRGPAVHLSRETAERLGGDVAQLVRTVKHLGHRVAADLYGYLPSFGWALLPPAGAPG